VATRPERLLIWGAGGHGKVLADLVRACGHELVGFVDADPLKMGEVAESGGAVVVMTEDDLRTRLRSKDSLHGGATGVVCAVGCNKLRAKHVELLGQRAAAVMCHPSASVSSSAAIGRGSVVLPRAVINADARIGPGCIINSAAIVEHDCVLETGVHISPGAVLSGGVLVGRETWIGAGAVVIEGIQIGANTTVGAGAVVVRNLQSAVTAVGVPAKPLPGAP
jgi:sugar O-acyltransferase (sialic acid O-acetyltransferase NeuD family)